MKQSQSISEYLRIGDEEVQLMSNSVLTMTAFINNKPTEEKLGWADVKDVQNIISDKLRKLYFEAAIKIKILEIYGCIEMPLQTFLKYRNTNEFVVIEDDVSVKLRIIKTERNIIIIDGLWTEPIDYVITYVELATVISNCIFDKSFEELKSVQISL